MAAGATAGVSESDSGSQGRRAEQASDAGGEHRPLATSGTLETLWSLLKGLSKVHVRIDRTVACLLRVAGDPVGAME